MDKILTFFQNNLGIIGTIGTIFFGILSVYFYLKKTYPGKLIIFIENTINLFDLSIKKFNNLYFLASHICFLFKNRYLRIYSY